MEISFLFLSFVLFFCLFLLHFYCFVKSFHFYTEKWKRKSIENKQEKKKIFFQTIFIAKKFEINDENILFSSVRSFDVSFLVARDKAINFNLSETHKSQCRTQHTNTV